MSASIEQAAAALERGELVVVVTDTVVGLAARPDRPEAIAAIYAAKARPAGLALPLLCADRAQAAATSTRWTPLADRLAVAGWPGGLTLVVDAEPSLAEALGAQDATVALRVPAAPALLELLGVVGPLATTSCNRHGEAPVADLAGARTLLGVDVVCLDGPAPRGVASTVVDARGTEPVVLRAGAVDLDQLS